MLISHLLHENCPDLSRGSDTSRLTPEPPYTSAWSPGILRLRTSCTWASEEVNIEKFTLRSRSSSPMLGPVKKRRPPEFIVIRSLAADHQAQSPVCLMPALHPFFSPPCWMLEAPRPGLPSTGPQGATREAVSFVRGFGLFPHRQVTACCLPMQAGDTHTDCHTVRTYPCASRDRQLGAGGCTKFESCSESHWSPGGYPRPSALSSLSPTTSPHLNCSLRENKNSDRPTDDVLSIFNIPCRWAVIFMS